MFVFFQIRDVGEDPPGSIRPALADKLNADYNRTWQKTTLGNSICYFYLTIKYIFIHHLMDVHILLEGN